MTLILSLIAIVITQLIHFYICAKEFFKIPRLESPSSLLRRRALVERWFLSSLILLLFVILITILVNRI